MSITLRPFAWRDLGILHRYRNRALCLDSSLGATRGPVLVPGALLSYLSPATGIFTWVCTNDCDEQPLMGQIVHIAADPFARITFLAPHESLDSPSLLSLLEQLAQQAGERGAFHLLAEIDERSPVFDAMRKAGFAVYARQRIWRFLGAEAPVATLEIPWEAVASKESFAIQALYHNVVPGLVQQVEPLSADNLRGLVCYKNSDLIGYVELKYGHQGIWAQPFIDPDVENIDRRIQDLINSIPERRARPVNLCVRSYQSWLEPALDALGAAPGPVQAVMVKRLVVHHRVARALALPKIESQPEVSAPIARAKRNH